MFKVSISLEDSNIIGEFVVDSYFFEPAKYEYAFYLYRNEEKSDTQWYSDNMAVSFDLKNMVGIFYIRAFVRDKVHGDKRTFDSEKITIDIVNPQ